MSNRELMQQALDALEYLATQTRPVYSAEDAIKALRERLAQPELVGKHLQFSGPMHVVCQCDQCKAQPKPYAAQAATVASQTQSRMSIDPVTGDVGIGSVKRQREWQGLSEFERVAIRSNYAQLKSVHYDEKKDMDIVTTVVSSWDALFTAIEQALKEKNT